MKATLPFVLVFLFAGSLEAREPAWVFNNGPDAKSISLGQGQLVHEVGLTKLIPTGTDLTLTVLSDKSYSAFPVVGDNTWRNTVVDMRKFDHKNWAGTITSFRFDPTNPSDTDSVYHVSRLGFFPTVEEAERFLEAAVDAPDFSEPTQFVAPLQRVLVPGDCLFEGFDRADFMLRSTAIDHPSETTVVRFQPNDAPDQAVIVPLCETNRRGFTRFVAKRPGDYRLIDGGAALDDLSDLSKTTRLAIQFVVARKLIGAIQDRKFRPHDPLADAEWKAAVAALNDYDIHLSTVARPATRAEAAAVLQTAIQTSLGTAIESPFTNEYLIRDRIRIGAWVSPRQEAIGHRSPSPPTPLPVELARWKQ